MSTADCAQGLRDLFASGDWMDAAYCFLTGGGDPVLTVMVPLVIYSTILLAYFIVGSSPLLPSVVSIILAGVIFSAFPATATTLVALSALVVLSIGGMALTWRLGR
ncbi:hypothetical protein GCM10009661_84490 [Catellatospora chokoriensis]|uniref:hypothetical protein n=1 Tax=Catellatospora chokoriensis TaxID=310353 RepID=UPI0031D1ED88